MFAYTSDRGVFDQGCFGFGVVSGKMEEFRFQCGSVAFPTNVGLGSL